MTAKRAQAKTAAAGNRQNLDRERNQGVATPAVSPVDVAVATPAVSDVGSAVATPVVSDVGSAVSTPAVTADDVAVATPAVSHVEIEVVEALTCLGYKTAEARRAVANTADLSAVTFEDRLRAALASLSRSRPIRCSDSSFDWSAGLPLWFTVQSWQRGLASPTSHVLSQTSATQSGRR
jgi:hypothetical protein